LVWKSHFIALVLSPWITIWTNNFSLCVAHHNLFAEIPNWAIIRKINKLPTLHIFLFVFLLIAFTKRIALKSLNGKPVGKIWQNKKSDVICAQFASSCNLKNQTVTSLISTLDWNSIQIGNSSSWQVQSSTFYNTADLYGKYTSNNTIEIEFLSGSFY
jgi:ABC-type sulfate transport system permease component